MNICRKLTLLLLGLIITLNSSSIIGMDEAASAVASSLEKSLIKELVQAIKIDNLEEFKRLFEALSLSVNRPRKEGKAPILCFVAIFNALKIFRHLVEEKKANINIRHKKLTPYLLAANSGNLEIVRYLVEEKNAQISDISGKTPLSLAAQKGHADVVEFLINRPEYDRIIDGPLALALANKNNHANVVQILEKNGVPALPTDAPEIFYNEEANSLFNFQTFPVIAYTQIPVKNSSDASAAAAVSIKPVNVYQLKVAQQEGVNETCIQEQLQSAAIKLGGTPEDHIQANPMYGGSCGYHATKNAFLGNLIFTDYDQLVEGITSANQEKKQAALKYLQGDIANITDFNETDDFDAKSLVEKIHAKTYRIHQLHKERWGDFAPRAIQQGFGAERSFIIKNKIENKLQKLLGNRYSEKYLKKISKVNTKTLEFSCTDFENLYLKKDLIKICENEMVFHLLQQIAQFKAQNIYRHTFILSYNALSVNGYGYGIEKNSMHAITIILDKRGKDINVLLLESNNSPACAIKKIIFDFLNLFIDERYPLDDEKYDLYNRCAANPYGVWINEPQKGLPSFYSLVENYIALKKSLEQKIDRDNLHKGFYLLEKIKQIYLRAHLMKDGESKRNILGILSEFKLIELPLKKKPIIHILRNEEIALHQKMEQCEQEELQKNLDRFILMNSLNNIQKAIDAGADPSFVNTDGESVLHSAIRSTVEIVQYFLENFAIDIEAKNKDGITPLMVAVGLDKHEITKLLLEYKAQVNAQDNNGNTPLMHCPTSPGLDAFKTTKLLTQQDADKYAKNNAGLSVAAVYFRGPRLDLFGKFIHEYNITVSAEELLYNIDSEARLGNRIVPFTPYLPVLGYLINKLGMKANTHPELSYKLLIQTIKSHRQDSFERLFEDDFAMNPNMQDEKGWTPLVHTVKEKNIKAFKALIEKYQANFKLQDNEGKTALDIAKDIIQSKKQENKSKSANPRFFKIDTRFVEYLEQLEARS